MRVKEKIQKMYVVVFKKEEKNNNKEFKRTSEDK